MKNQRENLQPGQKQETGSSKVTGGRGGGGEGGQLKAAEAYLETVQLLGLRAGVHRQKTEEEGAVSIQGKPNNSQPQLTSRGALGAGRWGTGHTQHVGATNKGKQKRQK